MIIFSVLKTEAPGIANGMLRVDEEGGQDWKEGKWVKGPHYYTNSLLLLVITNCVVIFDARK
jgi:hypothetical protein